MLGTIDFWTVPGTGTVPDVPAALRDNGEKDAQRWVPSTFGRYPVPGTVPRIPYPVFAARWH